MRAFVFVNGQGVRDTVCRSTGAPSLPSKHVGRRPYRVTTGHTAASTRVRTLHRIRFGDRVPAKWLHVEGLPGRHGRRYASLRPYPSAALSRKKQTHHRRRDWSSFRKRNRQKNLLMQKQARWPGPSPRGPGTSPPPIPRSSCRPPLLPQICRRLEQERRLPPAVQWRPGKQRFSS